MLRVDPVRYASTRNYADGAVTYLSPYLSRGVLCTRQVFRHIMSLDLTWYQSEKLVQELAWRDYWQQVWVVRGDDIFSDIKNTQEPVSNYQIPDSIANASTGIHAVDEAIQELFHTGYMHNHMRMYVASLCCNMANSHWLMPAKWMYANLLDGDLASNHLSWQWVAGAFSGKKYMMNQANINKFFNSHQKNTFLDIEYDQFDSFQTPEELTDTIPYELRTILPEIKHPILSKEKPTLIYNYYNLDPSWHEGQDVQRVLLLEPSVFKENPVAQKCIDFTLQLAGNIMGIKFFVGEFSELSDQLNPDLVVYKEHPLNTNYSGHEESREWLSSVTGYFPSFFAFWKKCKKELRDDFEKKRD